MPPLDAEYAAWPIWPSKAAALDMLTMAPRSPLSVGSLREIAVPTRRMQSKVPIRLIAITFENASRSAAELNSPSRPTVRWAQPMPAEFTSTRTGPSSSACAMAASICSVFVTSTGAKTPPTSSAVA